MSSLLSVELLLSALFKAPPLLFPLALALSDMRHRELFVDWNEDGSHGSQDGLLERRLSPGLLLPHTARRLSLHAKVC
jgi:hypothetical protein